MYLRWLTATGALVSGAVHLWLWFDGFRDIAWIGPMFLLNAVAGAAIAVALVLWRHWLPPLLALGFGLSTLGAFLLSATVGLLGVHETFVGFSQILAAVAELVAIGGGALVIVREGWVTWSRGEAQNRISLRRAHLH